MDLLVAIFSIVYSYRSAQIARQGHRLASQVHEENVKQTAILKQKELLRKLEEVRMNWLQCAMVLSDSLIVLEKIKKIDPHCEIGSVEKEREYVLENLKSVDEFVTKVSSVDPIKKPEMLDDLLLNIEKLVTSSSARLNIEQSRYRHICLDYRNLTGEDTP